MQNEIFVFHTNLSEHLTQPLNDLGPFGQIYQGLVTFKNSNTKTKLKLEPHIYIYYFKLTPSSPQSRTTTHIPYVKGSFGEK